MDELENTKKVDLVESPAHSLTDGQESVSSGELEHTKNSELVEAPAHFLKEGQESFSLGELEHTKNSELIKSQTHSLMHGIESAQGCTYAWSKFPTAVRARQCSHCSLRVVDTANMQEDEMLALLTVHGYEPGDKLYRRDDGRFVIGDCLKQRMGNMTTAVVFFLIPVASFLIFCHPTAIVLGSPGFLITALIGVPYLILGSVLAMHTRSATMCGIIFTCFVLPLLIAISIFAHL